jgi:hypothetical protein
MASPFCPASSVSTRDLICYHPPMSRAAITDALSLIFRGIQQLNSAFPNRAFTIDGRLVGDIGEVIAALEYDLVLDDKSQATYDAVAGDGRRVQIKATFKNSLTFRTVPDYYLGFKLYPDGRHEEIFNGPGQLIFDRYVVRKGAGRDLLSFPIAVLRGLSGQVPASDRIPRRSISELQT